MVKIKREYKFVNNIKNCVIDTKKKMGAKLVRLDKLKSDIK